MDTTGFIRFPFNFLEFFFGNDIVAPKNRSSTMAGDGHDGEMVVAGEANLCLDAPPDGATSQTPSINLSILVNYPTKSERIVFKNFEIGYYE